MPVPGFPGHQSGPRTQRPPLAPGRAPSTRMREVAFAIAAVVALVLALVWLA